MWGILYLCGWKAIIESSIYERHFVPLQLENHTLVIHLCEIFCTPTVENYTSYHTLVIHLHEKNCTFAVGKSSFKLGDLSNEFHEHLVFFHMSQFIGLGWILSHNRMIITSLGIFTYTILYGFIPLWLENHLLNQGTHQMNFMNI